MWKTSEMIKQKLNGDTEKYNGEKLKKIQMRFNCKKNSVSMPHTW